MAKRHFRLWAAALDPNPQFQKAARFDSWSGRPRLPRLPLSASAVVLGRPRGGMFGARLPVRALADVPEDDGQVDRDDQQQHTEVMAQPGRPASVNAIVPKSAQTSPHTLSRKRARRALCAQSPFTACTYCELHS
ncbi:hypothetical protein SPURM210S_03306 [Streptomyces purpurascens]